jgi:hypothetical protein
MDHPLFVCFVDRGTAELTIYSCSRIWLGLFVRRDAESLTLIPDSHGPPEHFELTEEAGKPVTLRVYMGPPILRINIASLEKNPDMPYSVMEPWVEEGVANIARRNLGGISTSTFALWKPNESPSPARFVRYYVGAHFDGAERDVAAMLTGLAHNYRHHRLTGKLEALRPYLAHLTPYLDDHGRMFADGSL